MLGFFKRLFAKRWRRWLIFGSIGFVLLGTVSVEATSRSSFCNNCHIMEPYYASWAKGSHKNVACVDCHIAPGVNSFLAAKLNGLGQVVDDVLHRTSNKPSASVSEFSCTRSGCHSIETLKKTEINNGRFKFRHDKHLGAKHLDVEITCVTCHSHVKGEAHFEVNTTVCITCHLVDGAKEAMETSGGKSTKLVQLSVRKPNSELKPGGEPLPQGQKSPPSTCTTCHDAPKHEIEFNGLKFDHAQFLAFGASCESCHSGVTATPPPIDDGRCIECHDFGLERVLPSGEMHRVHTLGKHKIECSSCHGAVRHGPNVQTASLESFDCTRCHIAQHGVQRATYFNLGHTAPDADLMSPMFLAHVDCTGCHTKQRPVSVKPDSGASVMAAEPAACDRCHQAGFGARMIPLWQNSTHQLFNQLTADLQKAQASGADAAKLAEVKKLLDRVRVDGSWGVHNPRFTQQLLEQARTQLTAASGGKTGGS
ncbi:MAG: NapC/NirT family cytochrome c [Phycisphaerales bacterium]